MKDKIFVGVSGGVDSSVSLERLVHKGNDVTAVFIKTWQPDFIVCNWEKERLDAMRVAAHLDVPFVTFDAEQAYKEHVAEYMIREYTEGRTPNPDVMCNQYVKFGVFLDFARANGAQKIATGHYAQCLLKNGYYELHRGMDTEKDQSYFLWTLTQEQLSHTLFPIGDTVKASVRAEAEREGLPTFAKHDSQGICFLGPIDIKDFLSHYINTTPGPVYDEAGNQVGVHDGAFYYTLGQRHGFSIIPASTTTQPYYIVKKDIEHNTLVVAHQVRECTQKKVALTSVNLITEIVPQVCTAQFRYRQTPFQVRVETLADGHGMLEVLDAHVEMPSRGQSCVLYTGTRCIGGGIINDIL